MGIDCSCIADIGNPEKQNEIQSLESPSKDHLEIYKETGKNEDVIETSKRQDTTQNKHIQDLNVGENPLTVPESIQNPNQKMRDAIQTYLSSVNHSVITVELIKDKEFEAKLKENKNIQSVLSKMEPQLQQIDYNKNEPVEQFAPVEQFEPVAINRHNNEGQDYYFGFFNSNGQACGLGTLITQEGSIYKGSFEKGVFNGKGLIVNPNGDYFFGEWKNGECNGEGLTKCNGYTYIGHYKDNKKSGKGKETFANGTRYEGEFINNERHGKGKITYLDGSSYEGDFYHSVLEGKGVYCWSDNRRYEGNFKNGQMNGEGDHQWGDGTRYIGNYVNNTKTGAGKYIFSHGTELNSNWSNNEPQGKCSYLTNGVQYEIIFRYGKIISAKPLSQNGVMLKNNNMLFNQELLVNPQE